MKASQGRVRDVAPGELGVTVACGRRGFKRSMVFVASDCC